MSVDSIEIQKASITIRGILAEQMVTGSMDSELNTFQTIEGKMLAGEISPATAIHQVKTLVEGRQDYH